MMVIFTENALEEYISWQTEDKKTLRRINQLIKDIWEGFHVRCKKLERL